MRIRTALLGFSLILSGPANAALPRELGGGLKISPITESLSYPRCHQEKRFYRLKGPLGSSLLRQINGLIQASVKFEKGCGPNNPPADVPGTATYSAKVEGCEKWGDALVLRVRSDFQMSGSPENASLITAVIDLKNGGKVDLAPFLQEKGLETLSTLTHGKPVRMDQVEPKGSAGFVVLLSADKQPHFTPLEAARVFKSTVLTQALFGIK
jgi:hypothetical protein